MFDRENMIITGDPDTCIRKIEEYQRVGADGVLCMMQTGNIAHEHVMRSIELFGKYVIPKFKNPRGVARTPEAILADFRAARPAHYAEREAFEEKMNQKQPAVSGVGTGAGEA
jgi:hypothetical protein